MGINQYLLDTLALVNAQHMSHKPSIFVKMHLLFHVRPWQRWWWCWWCGWGRLNGITVHCLSSVCHQLYWNRMYANVFNLLPNDVQACETANWFSVHNHTHTHRSNKTLRLTLSQKTISSYVRTFFSVHPNAYCNSIELSCSHPYTLSCENYFDANSEICFGSNHLQLKSTQIYYAIQFLVAIISLNSRIFW